MNRAQVAFLALLVIGALLIAGAFIIRAAEISTPQTPTYNIQLETK